MHELNGVISRQIVLDIDVSGTTLYRTKLTRQHPENDCPQSSPKYGRSLFDFMYRMVQKRYPGFR